MHRAASASGSFAGCSNRGFFRFRPFASCARKIAGEQFVGVAGGPEHCVVAGCDDLVLRVGVLGHGAREGAPVQDSFVFFPPGARGFVSEPVARWLHQTR